MSVPGLRIRDKRFRFIGVRLSLELESLALVEQKVSGLCTAFPQIPVLLKSGGLETDNSDLAEAGSIITRGAVLSFCGLSLID